MTEEAVSVMKEFFDKIFGNSDFKYCCNFLFEEYKNFAEDYNYADYEVSSDQLAITFDCFYIEKTKDWNKRKMPYVGISVDLNTYKIDTFTDFN